MFAEPLAQDYVEVARPPSPQIFIGECALTYLPGGDLLASHRLFSRPDHPRWSFKMSRSRDGGQSWEPMPALDLCDGLPFVHDNHLYLLANNVGNVGVNLAGEHIHGGPHAGRNIVITRSDDEGQSWLEPVTLFEGSFWNAPTGTAVANNHLYRAFDVPDPDAGNLDAVGHSVVVAAGDLSQNLLDPTSWRISDPVEFPGVPDCLKRGLYDRYNDNRWVEPNVVCVHNKLRILSRVRIDRMATAGMCTVCDLDDDGKGLSCRFVQFHPMPGGQCKFYIVYDESSKLFWTPTNLPTNTQDLEWDKQLKARGFHQTPGNERRFLMLMYSMDALNWFQAGCIAMSSNPLQSFHYAAPLIDGDNLLILSRTSQNAPNQHDSDLLSFHRVKDFRSLALNLHPDL